MPILCRTTLAIIQILPSTFRPGLAKAWRRARPLALSRVHWVRFELVAELTFSNWTDDNLLRHPLFVSLREDKRASEVRRKAAK